MHRDKLIERARKLLAMSRDPGSPVEAAIAERRLNALMGQYDISFAEIRRFERSSEKKKDSGPQASGRRKRTSSSVQRTQPPPGRKHNRIIAFIAFCGFITALGFWFLFSGVVEIKSPLGDIAYELRAGKPHEQLTSTLTAQVDRATAVEGDSVVLYITGSGVLTVPNTSSLWQDFKILGTEVTQTRSPQGFRLRVMLQPRRTGTLVIPSFRVNEIGSELIVLDVLPRS